MMRAKSAMFYIKDVEEITKELLDLCEDKKDANNSLDIHPLLQLWSLESIAYIFLDKRLYCFSTDDTKDNQDGKNMVEANRIMNVTNLQLFFMPKIWQYFSNLMPPYRKYVIYIYNHCRKILIYPHIRSLF